MLNSIILNDKSYEELLAEAIARIPLYSGEWTNYNASDPGITMLQNLTAFQMLQQEEIDIVTDEAKAKLLKLVGYTAKNTSAAEIFVQAPSDGGPILHVGHRLWSGSVPFEVTEPVELSPWGIKGVYVNADGNLRDVTRLVGDRAETFAYPFGKSPVAGSSFITVFDGVPEVGVPVRLWLNIAEEEIRTPFDDLSDIPEFSRVRWQYYTDSGWKDATAQDETIGLLRSGLVTLIFSDELPRPFEQDGISGCAVRCLLETADYDLAPRLRSISAHLFMMKQQNTRVQCIVNQGGERITIRGRLAKLGNIRVFCKEEPDGAYYEYRMSSPVGGTRLFTYEETEWGAYLRFGEDSSLMPCDAPDAVRVICYDEEMIHHRLLGPIYGYDNQRVTLDVDEPVISSSLLIMLENVKSDGSCEYLFVSPDEDGPDGFRYHLNPEKNELVIDEPGFYGYNMQLAHCATTKGSRGNIRAGSVLEQRGGYDGTETEATFECPAPGRGGCSHETFEDVRKRFSAGIRETTVAVRTEDYEKLVKQTPGLCIHKVRAMSDHASSLVRIAVKPYSEEKFPKLSEEYLKRISAYLEPRRMLTTSFEICAPKYVPIGVSATVSIRGTQAYARKELEEYIASLVDFVNGTGNFGDGIRFNDMYHKIRALPFVEAVDMLNIFPEGRDAHLTGSDITVSDDCLCCPGTITLNIREYGR